MRKEYLRDRPFLTVELSYRPSPDANTGERGWQQKPGAMQTIEKVSFLDRIRDDNNFVVIIDIINSAVIKNRYGKSEDELMANYLGKYSEEVKAALAAWARRMASKIATEA